MIDDALRQAATGSDPQLSDDDWEGLRILFGLHPRYRTEGSPTVRREQASELLVPLWLDHPPRDRAGTFQRRYQERALRQVLTCLRSIYGQEDGPTDRDCDVLEEHGTAIIDERRQIRYARCEEVLRIRHEGLTEFSWDEGDLETFGAVSTDLRMVPHPTTGQALTIARIAESTYMPGSRKITVRLPHPMRIHELVASAWEEEATYGDEVSHWETFYLATQPRTIECSCRTNCSLRARFHLSYSLFAPTHTMT